MSEYKDELIRRLRKRIEQDEKEKALYKKRIREYEKRSMQDDVKKIQDKKKIKRYEKRIKKDRKEKALYRKEGMQYRKEIREYDKKSRQDDKRHEQDQIKIGQLEQQLDFERRMWSATWEDGRRSTDNAAFMHRLEVLDDIIDGGSLQPTTSMNRRQFDYISDRFTKLAKKHTEGPLFSEDEDNFPGNRCKLSYRHALLMSLMRKYGNPTQEQLAAFFGIDQSTVCRYLRYCDMIFLKMLPTPNAVSRRIRNTRTIEELKGLVPDLAVIVDGTHIDIQRPTDKEPRKEAYSGKKKSFTRNVQVLASKSGLTLYASESSPGSAHDLTMIRDNPPDLGILTARMRSNRKHPEKEKVKLLSDLGYVGIKELYPGAISMQPHKKPRGGKLTRKQKAHNRRISSKRVTVEHAIGGIKRYKRMRDPYDGAAEEFDREFQVTAGLANFRLLWDKPNKKLMHGF